MNLFIGILFAILVLLDIKSHNMVWFWIDFSLMVMNFGAYVFLTNDKEEDYYV
jgi:hypothetical protein